MHTYIFLATVSALLLIRLIQPILVSTFSSLRSLPGPFLARFSRLYYFRAVRSGDWHHTNIALHARHGPIVRVAPDHYSIDDPAAIKTIYGVGSKWAKSDWYEAWKHPSPERWSLFSDRNMERHAATRRVFQPLYSMSSLVSYEGFVDDCAEVFCARLDGFAKSGEVVDLAHWFQCYAFDVIGAITYSTRFGFLDKGEDLEGTIRALKSSNDFSALAGIYASWYPLLYKVMEKVSPKSGPAGRQFLTQWVAEKITRRKEEVKEGTHSLNTPEEDGAPKDFLTKVMLAKEQKPDKVNDYHLVMMSLSNVIAGSETTGVTLSAILYYLLKNPETLKKLQEEIHQFEGFGKIGLDGVDFKTAQDMTYLQAVMKEALRVHSVSGLPLWRVVPDGGAEVSGRYFPAGTVLGVDIWVAHYNEDVFKDPEAFRPERWIDQDPDALARMDAYYFPFGLGSRTCIGKHISTLEMSKLVPQILRRYNFALDDPHNEWKCDNFSFVKPRSLRVRIQRRLV